MSPFSRPTARTHAQRTAARSAAPKTAAIATPGKAVVATAPLGGGVEEGEVPALDAELGVVDAEEEPGAVDDGMMGALLVRGGTTAEALVVVVVVMLVLVLTLRLADVDAEVEIDLEEPEEVGLLEPEEEEPLLEGQRLGSPVPTIHGAEFCGVP